MVKGFQGYKLSSYWLTDVTKLSLWVSYIQIREKYTNNEWTRPSPTNPAVVSETSRVLTGLCLACMAGVERGGGEGWGLSSCFVLCSNTPLSTPVMQPGQFTWLMLRSPIFFSPTPPPNGKNSHWGGARAQIYCTLLSYGIPYMYMPNNINFQYYFYFFGLIFYIVYHSY